ncbi:MAG: response regulator, partial [Deltaproteobacteria bacterium]|nr:response regulator [Deltaproteobacteria bacterium]
DEVGPRESLRAILKPDYQVLVAVEGEQAIRVVEQTPVDVVLLDLRMPGLSGIRVMEKIKAINPDIEVILVTGYASYETVLEALRLHAFDYIPKPFNVPHLRDMVKRAATHRHGHERLKQATEEETSAPNEALEQHIIELTAELTAANKEIETFRDFVSHNLRTPLRTLDDLSQALLADYANQLDTPGKDALQRVRATSQGMAQIIEDLLSRAMRRLTSTWPTLTKSLEPSSACTRG